MSHDFVEAAYIKRAGFEVWNIPSGEGSYEEQPQNAIEYLKRDRRWCHGNLQHSRILFERGLHTISRFHLICGILAYLANLLWLSVLGFSLLRFSYEAAVGPNYFNAEYQLFPSWPTFKTQEAIALFTVTMAMLCAPKILGGFVLLSRPQELLGFGGSIRLLVSILLELLISTLLAPVMMVWMSCFIVSLIRGRKSSWNAQQRNPERVQLTEALRSLIVQCVLCALMFYVVFFMVPDQLWWMVPILLGLALGPFVVCLTSEVSLGDYLQRWRLFATPDDSQSEVANCR